MNIPCDNPCIRCPPGIGGGIGPIDPDNPFINLSSEDPDAIEFIGRNFFGDGKPPPLDSFWTRDSCFGLCISTVSQADADLCAMRQAQLCLWTDPLFRCVANDPRPECQGRPGEPLPREIFNNQPQQCAFTCDDGAPFIFTVAAGLFSDVSQLAANLQAFTYACNKAAENRICLGQLTPVRTCSNSLYSGSVASPSANLPISFSIVGELPDGLLMTTSESVAFFNGTVTVPGGYSWTVVATDSVGNVTERLVTLDVFGVATVSLPDGEVGAAYSGILQYGGTPAGAVTFTITSGVLPDGLILNSATGEITGTPTTEETQTLTVTVADGTLVCHKSLGIQIAATQDCPDWSTLLWGVPTYFELGTGAASFTPDSAAGNIFLMGLVAAPINPNQAEVVQTATIPYNGTGCQIQLTLDIQNVGGAMGSGTIQVVSDLAGALYNNSWVALGAGVHVEGFFIPDTGGMPSVITVQVTGQKVWDLTPGTMQVQGTFENFI